MTLEFLSHIQLSWIFHSPWTLEILHATSQPSPMILLGGRGSVSFQGGIQKIFAGSRRILVASFTQPIHGTRQLSIPPPTSQRRPPLICLRAASRAHLWSSALEISRLLFPNPALPPHTQLKRSNVD